MSPGEGKYLETTNSYGLVCSSRYSLYRQLSLSLASGPAASENQCGPDDQRWTRGGSNDRRRGLSRIAQAHHCLESVLRFPAAFEERSRPAPFYGLERFSDAVERLCKRETYECL